MELVIKYKDGSTQTKKIDIISKSKQIAIKNKLFNAKDGYLIEDIIFLTETKYNIKKEFPTIYHGSKHKFSKFQQNVNLQNLVTRTEFSDNDMGLFFTDNLIMAKYFAGIHEYSVTFEDYVQKDSGYIYKVDLNISNPYIIESDDEDYDSVQIWFNLIKENGLINFKSELIDNGYDSVILKDAITYYYADGTYSTIIVFDPKNIKIQKVKEIKFE